MLSVGRFLIIVCIYSWWCCVTGEITKKVETHPRNLMNETYSSYQKPDSSFQQTKREQYQVKPNWKSDDVRGLLEKNLSYKPKNSPKEEVISIQRDERITTAVTSTNPFGDEDEDDEIDEKNPFSNDLEDDNEDDPDDYDKNLNPFSS